MTLTINCAGIAQSGSESLHAVRNGAALLLFYDAQCAFCVAMLAWLKRHTRQHIVAAGFQSALAGELLFSASGEQSCVLVLCKQGKWEFYRRGAAMQQLLGYCTGVYGFTGRLLGLIPLQFSNLIYDIIAANRFRLIKTARRAK